MKQMRCLPYCSLPDVLTSAVCVLQELGRLPYDQHFTFLFAKYVTRICNVRRNEIQVLGLSGRCHWNFSLT
jgi:hypothetical protein